MDLDTLSKLVEPNESKILLLVMDGVGGLPMQSGGMTELAAANTPNLDALAAEGICGLHEPVGPGITPGSGPSHLALFGYDPLRYEVGRGVLSALGINFDLQPGDVAARGNFCTIDETGKVTDRRAGRIPTEMNRELCKILRQIELPGAEVFVETVKEYRFLLVLRGEDLGDEVADTDPQDVGHMPLPARAEDPGSERTADLVQAFTERARELLADQHPANMVLLRGFSSHPRWPLFNEVYQLRAAAIAGYPMYRGVAKLVGMTVLDSSAEVPEEVGVLEQNWTAHDFFYLHVKRTDSAGEDGDFDRKVALIEEVDEQVPRMMDLKPDVVVVTGDHSTPSRMRYHSWHPVPVLLWSPICRQDGVRAFSESACLQGGLGPRFPATDLMPLAMANARRLEKYGA
jgi:2,3-bisphosphoglycerate-independent phosphoglycerate mutase